MTSKYLFPSISLLGVISLISYCIYNETLGGSIEHTSDPLFEDFLSKFGKSYTSLNEYEMRKSIFNSNLQFIMSDETLAINEMMDWTEEEIEKRENKRIYD